jgi:hypothetical protein
VSNIYFRDADAHALVHQEIGPGYFADPGRMIK